MQGKTWLIISPTWLNMQRVGEVVARNVKRKFHKIVSDWLLSFR